MQEEAERVQAALGEAERALQRLVDARATVAEVLAEPPSVVEGLRSKAKRLVERGWARQARPGVFTALVVPAD
ncbi:hypothetical protein [Streptomyces caelestis]|uniref:hypothetical protein n=1 Tax=Streptomyces caelestis TaxID=36816 RepID=UPI00365D8DD9